jgi:hypothetical protein
LGGEETAADHHQLELGEGREVVVNLTLTNSGDPAYFAWVTLNFRHYTTNQHNPDIL